MKEQMRRQKPNSGFSLVELVIAIAILAIVTGAVCSFIIIGSRGYARGNNDISVQQEAQLAFNQMSDVIIDATRSINYVGYDSANQPTKVLKDAEFTDTPDKKALIVYNIATAEETSSPSPSATPSPTLPPVNDDRQNYMFYWQKDDENLYFAEMNASGDFPTPGDEDCVILAEHVTDFEVDLSEVETRRVVKLHMVFDVGGRSFEMTNNITVRNQVRINDADIAALDKSVKVNVKVKEPYLILEPGETYHFSTPKLSGMNLINKALTWSIEGTVNSDTMFTDPSNGILQIAGGETAQSFQVKVTTAAVNDADGQPASDTITVYVKRVTQVTLSKLSDNYNGSEADRPQPTEVEQGATFVIGAVVDGVRLGEPCSGCEADYTTDKDVTNFEILKGAEYVTMVEGSATSSQATFTVKEDTPVGTEITIQATSVLSTRHTATYGLVQGQITLTVVKQRVKPYNGFLKHGIAVRIDDMLIAGFVSEVKNHVLVVHVVDNKTNQLMYEVLCQDEGWNMWISPDFFDLNLQGSYTFYLQAMESVSIEDYQQWAKNGGRDTEGTVPVSSLKDIWEEYAANKQSGAPYGYIGKKFRCSEVYGTVLEPIEFAYSYDNTLYCGEQFTLDTFNIVEHNIGNTQVNILSDVKFETTDGTKNIDHNSLHSGVIYNVYKGDGENKSDWTPLYEYDATKGAYKGDTSLYDGNLVIEENAGMRALKLKTGRIQDTCGTYHIVPGFVYNAKDHVVNVPNSYIGPDGFVFPYINATAHYYELPESTYHITVTAGGTMEMNCSEFRGNVCFPLPTEMKLENFPNLENTDWQEANLGTSGLTLDAIDASTGNLVSITFDKIRYHKIKIENEDVYEVEPLKVKTLDNGNGLEVTYSYGIYRCAATGTKWECKDPASTSTNATFSFEQAGKTYLARVPLPTDDDFMFGESSEERRKLGHSYYFNGFEQDNLLGYYNSISFGSQDLYCDYDSATGVYTLTFVENATDMPWDNPVRTVLNIKGQYTWKEGESRWSQSYGEGSILESRANLRYNSGTQTLETYIPAPGDTSYWVSWSETSQSMSVYRIYFYEIDNINAATQEYQNYTITYQKNSEDLYQIKIERTDHSSSFGTFIWNEGLKQWVLKTYS